MKTTNYFSMIIILLLAIAAGWYLLNTERDHSGHSHDSHGHHGAHDEGEEMKRGPHRGRLLVDDTFAIEVTIFEQGVPPEFHIYSYFDNKPLDPKQVELEIKLTRVDGHIDSIKFKPEQDFLRGDTVVYEPHSFVVSISAKYANKNYSWQYDNFEGRTQIANNMAKELGIKTEIAGPATLIETRILTGRIHTDPNRLSRVRPRFAGIVKAIRHELGDYVRAGDILATVQSNESLQNYQIKAPIGGLIIKRDIQIGEATGNEPLFVIADLSEVWIELDIFLRDLNQIKAGQEVIIETFDGSLQAKTVIDWISPLTTHASQSVHARARLKNKEGVFRPGQFIRAEVIVDRHKVPLAVRHSAIQAFRDFKVVYAQFGDTYEVRMLEFGREDKQWIEVVSGLKPGTTYVTENSYLIKADIEKSGASHDH